MKSIVLSQKEFNVLNSYIHESDLYLFDAKEINTFGTCLLSKSNVIFVKSNTSYGDQDQNRILYYLGAEKDAKIAYRDDTVGVVVYSNLYSYIERFLKDELSASIKDFHTLVFESKYSEYLVIIGLLHRKIKLPKSPPPTKQEIVEKVYKEFYKDNLSEFLVFNELLESIT